MGVVGVVQSPAHLDSAKPCARDPAGGDGADRSSGDGSKISKPQTLAHLRQTAHHHARSHEDLAHPQPVGTAQSPLTTA